MKELSHPKHRYQGKPGEVVTMTVRATNTNHMVHYVLDGILPAKVFPEHQPLRFNLKNQSGMVTPLQLSMDFNALGSYEITVEVSENCPKDALKVGKCTHTRQGPPMAIENYKFSVE
jgi:hypothetical protein